MKTKKKYAIGGILTGLNAALSVVGGFSQKKQLKEAILENMGNTLSNRKTQDQYALEDFPEEGYNVDTYYQAKGGTLPMKAKGGSLNSISSDMVDVVGPKHSQGGVDVGGAEVEGGEVIKDGKRVYSDQLEVEPGVTYAAKAEQYAKLKSKFENKLTSGDPFSAATAKRKIEILDTKEDKLFQKQEQSKTSDTMSTEKMNKGGFLKGAVPYLDNVVNAGLNFLTPKVPKPTLIKPRKLDTNINVNPQLNEVSRAVDSASKAIMDNTNNSAVARNAIARTRLQGSAQKANILGNKENQETQLRNANVYQQSRTDQINAGKTDAYNNANVARSSSMISNASQNLANASDDFINSENLKSQKEYQNNQLAAILASGDYGVGDRLMERYKRMIEQMKND